MPEIRLFWRSETMLPAGRKHGKKTRAARSRTREKPSCRKILTLCKVPERGAPKPLPKQRGRAGPGRPDARRNKGGVGRAAVEDRPGLDAGKGPGRAEPGVAVSGDVPKAASPRKTAAGQRFSEERRRCRCREAAKKTRGRRGVATTPAFCPKEPARARMDAGRANSPPPHLAARSSRKRAAAGGQAACACAKKHRRRGSEARPCACVRARKPSSPAPKGAATHGEKLPNAGQKSPAGPLLLQRNPAGRHP